VYKNPVYADNPQMANWPISGKNRAIFTDDDAEKIVSDVRFVRPRYVKVKNKKTGKVSYAINGGPYIEVGDFFYTSSDGNQRAVRKSSLFTWTSKMSCPSFSPPAGPTKEYGTCPASVEAAVESEGGYLQYHQPLSERPADQIYICKTCYAGKGNYLYPSVSIGQRIRWAWTKKTLREGSFVDQIVEAIEFLQDPSIEELLLKKMVSNKYFRIHDAGDFLTTDYYMAWIEICQRLKNIRFWAPTRQWVFEKWRKTFADAPPPTNLALRPSALFTTAVPPDIDGMAAGTTSMDEKSAPRAMASGKMPQNLKNCPAYEGDAEHSCAAARCRTCWDQKDTPVNYKTH